MWKSNNVLHSAREVGRASMSFGRQDIPSTALPMVRSSSRLSSAVRIPPLGLRTTGAKGCTSAGTSAPSLMVICSASPSPRRLFGDGSATSGLRREDVGSAGVGEGGFDPSPGCCCCCCGCCGCGSLASSAVRVPGAPGWIPCGAVSNLSGSIPAERSLARSSLSLVMSLRLLRGAMGKIGMRVRSFCAAKPL
jgi:hypothetical protein